MPPMRLRQGGDQIGVMDKIKGLFSKSKSMSSADEISVVGTIVPFEDTSYREKPGISNEEMNNLSESLTPRERDTYLLLMEGFTLKETAKQLGVRYSTVNTYQTAIYRKLHVNSRAELIINYRDIGEGKKKKHRDEKSGGKML